MLTGKANGILMRLPHFFGPAEAGDLLLQFVDTFGRSIEDAETDLYRVLHGHHVETADNLVGSSGRRGDLDRLLALYLDSVGGTSQLVKVSPSLTIRSFDPRRLARSLVTEGTALSAYVRASMPTDDWRGVEAYQIENAAFRPAEIQHDMAMDLLLGRGPIGAYLRDRLSPRTAELLQRYDGSGTVGRVLASGIADDLNGRVLSDPSLYRRHLDFFESIEVEDDPGATIRELRAGIYGDTLRARLEHPLPTEQAQRIRQDLASFPPIPAPAGDDLRRLNRLLLEVAGQAMRPQWSLRRSGIPSVEEVRRTLLLALNRLLADPALFSARRFPSIGGDYPTLERRYAGRLDWLNRLLLESAFPDAIEPSHSPYRRRLQGLIQVLRRGASTRQGIIDIVAANLGIVGDDAAVRDARAKIEIEEYLPERTHFFGGRVGYGAPFILGNPTLMPASPEVRFVMLPTPDGSMGDRELANIRIHDQASKGEVRWPGRLRAQDQLVMSGGTVLLNGITPSVGLVGTVPDVAEGGAVWTFDADVVVAGSEAGTERALPIGRFDRAVGAGMGTFGSAVYAPASPPVALDISSYKPNPGIFTVVIPWDIEGFTDKFDEDDHPRKQIGGLVDRVKAAGVRAMVAYRIVFSEALEMQVGLGVAAAGAALSEEQDLQDDFSADTQQSVREDHDQVDALQLSARLDYTRFNSGNGLA